MHSNSEVHNTATISNPTSNIDSDDEDSDYVPPSPKNASKSRKRHSGEKDEVGGVSGEDSESGSSDSDSDSNSGSLNGEATPEEREKKRLRRNTLEGAKSVDSSSEVKTQEPSGGKEKERIQAEIWAKFTESASAASSEVSCQAREMVKIEKKYLFAGETVTEVVEVPADSPDAKKWPLWKPPQEAGPPTNAVVAQTIHAPPPHQSSATPDPQPIADIPPSVSTKRRPGPRKPKVNLAPLPGSSVSGLGGAKPKKLTTLDKSAMDWRAHIQSESTSSGVSITNSGALKDELDAHRRGGAGYLDKVEFLNRVDERKGEILESMKSQGKRRRT
ncbi:hypothetical protein AX16_010342 [Volvariella volvacea WC 439]|nr:hypothetical protein AX16_010342 [Volvariella volvacea WC 439]